MNISAIQRSSHHLHSPKPYPSLSNLNLHKTNSLQLKCKPSSLKQTLTSKYQTSSSIQKHQQPQNEHRNNIIPLIPRWVLLGGTSVSIAALLLLLGLDGQNHEALAFGPEGPLVEEFWDNMRRYGLYILTVSSGVLYAIFQPIYELLKNPITAVLVITVVGGGGFLVYQVVNLMVGVTEFSYDYGY